jgi:hypothetical protein
VPSIFRIEEKPSKKLCEKKWPTVVWQMYVYSVSVHVLTVATAAFIPPASSDRVVVSDNMYAASMMCPQEEKKYQLNKVTK